MLYACHNRGVGVSPKELPLAVALLTRVSCSQRRTRTSYGCHHRDTMRLYQRCIFAQGFELLRRKQSWEVKEPKQGSHASFECPAPAHVLTVPIGIGFIAPRCFNYIKTL